MRDICAVHPPSSHHNHTATFRSQTLLLSFSTYRSFASNAIKQTYPQAYPFLVARPGTSVKSLIARLNAVIEITYRLCLSLDRQQGGIGCVCSHMHLSALSPDPDLLYVSCLSRIKDTQHTLFSDESLRRHQITRHQFTPQLLCFYQRCPLCLLATFHSLDHSSFSIFFFSSSSLCYHWCLLKLLKLPPQTTTSASFASSTPALYLAVPT